jgi:hypothetical protein
MPEDNTPIMESQSEGTDEDYVWADDDLDAEDFDDATEEELGDKSESGAAA